MSFTVTLCNNSSPVEKIGKTLSEGSDFTCALKDNTSILRPTLILRSDNASLAGFNYMKIPEFNRFYFIDDIVSLHNYQWEISGHVDVLETYATEIKANQAVIKRQAKLYNLYLDDPEFHVLNYERIQCYKFPANAFTKSFSFLLVANNNSVS